MLARSLAFLGSIIPQVFCLAESCRILSKSQRILDGATLFAKESSSCSKNKTYLPCIIGHKATFLHLMDGRSPMRPLLDMDMYSNHMYLT